MMFSSSSSSCEWRPPLSRSGPQAQRPPHHRQQQQQHSQQPVNARFVSLLQRSQETPPQPQAAVHASVRSLRATAASPAQEHQLLQRDREDSPHPCMPGSSPSATLASGVDVGVGDPSSPAPSAANVPVWWSNESSILPHDDGDDSFSDGTCRPNTAGCMTDRLLASTPSTAKAQTSDDAAYLADLRRRVAAQVEKRGHGLPAAPRSAVASTAAPSPLPSTSSCGCPTSCTCRTDTSDDGAFGVSVDVYRRASRVCPAGRPRMESIAALRGACTECEARVAQDMNHFSDASSETGTTPVQRGSDEESDDFCSSCRYRHRDYDCLSFAWPHTQRSGDSAPLKLSSEGSTEGGSGGGEDASLCSLCQAAARARVAGRRGCAAPFARQDDSLVNAVREDGWLAEVPLLLHLSAPETYAAKRADRRSACMHSATALTGYADDERHGAYDGVTAGVRGLNRSTDSTQTGVVTPAAATANLSEQQCDPRTERAVSALSGSATAHYAEMTLPLLQGELASLEARTAVQQQACFDALASQMRGYYEEMRQRTQEMLDRQAQHQRRLEEQQVAQQAEAEAARRAAARVDRATSPMEIALAAQAAEATPQAASSPLPPQRAVGTQHTDGTLELLTAVRTEAASWMVQLFLSIEAERRDAVAQDEAECRDRLLHVVEGTCRCQLLRCQALVLYWQKECSAVRHQASFAPDLRALDLRERLARQQLFEEAALAQCELMGAFERQQCQAAEAAAHSQVKLLESEVADVKSKLAIVEAEHADNLEHMKQLRLQLIHALRMPTVTLVDRSSVSAAARGASEGAAAATAGAEYGDTACVRGDAHQGGADGLPSAWAASSTESGTGVFARHTVPSGIGEGLEGLPVHRRFARAHQEALRVTRAQRRTV
ncbi:hypothetical protein JIQ42_07773 [Leishmania sp. Namibia]|uniref:hypothetical protein n=1 Tax=Leishmania sp. Namibia TaxID=2802991 RepID=UPI001B586934|nr:hypothetical protein JIQ42_07773 [Leishmania sp. Namibia]